MEKIEQQEVILREVLSDRQLSLAKNAIQPLLEIAASELRNMRDSEEKFLLDQYVKGLIAAHDARVSSFRSADSRKVTRQDIRMAMVILGRVLSNIDDSVVSEETKNKLIAMCPYC